MDLMVKKYRKARNFWAKEMKQVREGLRISQEKAAEYLGIPVGTLRGWEQGRHEPAAYARQFMLDLLKSYPG